MNVEDNPSIWAEEEIKSKVIKNRRVVKRRWLETLLWGPDKRCRCSSTFWTGAGLTGDHKTTKKAGNYPTKVIYWTKCHFCRPVGVTECNYAQRSNN